MYVTYARNHLEKVKRKAEAGRRSADPLLTPSDRCSKTALPTIWLFINSIHIICISLRSKSINAGGEKTSTMLKQNNRLVRE